MRMGGGMRKNCYVYELFFLAACCLCFFGCGLESTYVLYEPIGGHSSTYSTIITEEKYFEFYTEENKNTINPPPFKFLGTAVYYKIYNQHEPINSVASALSSANNSSDPSSAAKLLKDTYKYRQLGTDPGMGTPLITSTGVDRRIYIRLTNYQTDPYYQAKIIVGYTGDSSISGTWIPKREGNRYSFDFGRGGSEDRRPIEGDNDYSHSSSGFSSSYNDTYFVDMYAVSVGRDENYTLQYSPVLHLGTVAVNAASEDN